MTRYFPTAVLGVGAAIAVWMGTPRPTPLARPLVEAIPATFYGATSHEVPLGPDEARVSGVTSYLSRAYELGGLGGVQIYIGYHATQQGTHGVHLPTLCLPGAGWVPVSSRLAAIPVAGESQLVNRYVLQQGQHFILVYYWFQGRGRITAGETALKVHTVIDALRSRRDEEALVRIVIPVASDSPTATAGNTGVPADSVATQFAATIIPTLQRVLPAPP